MPPKPNQSYMLIVILSLLLVAAPSPPSQGTPSHAGHDLSGGTVVEAARPLGRLLLGNGDDVDGDAIEL